MKDDTGTLSDSQKAFDSVRRLRLGSGNERRRNPRRPARTQPRPCGLRIKEPLTLGAFPVCHFYEKLLLVKCPIRFFENIAAGIPIFYPSVGSA